MIKFNKSNIFVDLRLKIFALTLLSSSLLLGIGIFFNTISIGYIFLIFLVTSLMSVIFLTKPVRKLKALYKNIPKIQKQEFTDFIKNTDVDDLYIVDEVDLVNYRLIGTAQYFNRYQKNNIKTAPNTQNNIDPLTKINNRKNFENTVSDMIAKSSSDQKNLFIIIDLDNFSDINYSYGHSVGDQFLVTTAEIIQYCMTHNNFNIDDYTYGRLNGDEFGIFIKNIHEHDANIILDYFNKELSSIHQSHQGNDIVLSCSIGAAMNPEHGRFFSELLTSSTVALQHSKQLSSNKITVFDSPDANFHNIKNNYYWNNFVKKDISGEFLNVYFQPIAKVGPTPDFIEISHYECLLRIKENENWVSPYQYILACERTGKITEIDFFMINEVFKYISILKRRDQLNDKKFSINISGVSFTHPDFSNYIIKKIEEHDIEARSIIFEITETAVIDNFEKALGVIDSINDLGFSFALDDFGIGFSNFNILKSVNATYVKIDGSFISDLVNNPKDKVIVKAINDMSHSFGQKTVAEFVEDAETFDLLNELGIDFAQGYFIDKPESFSKHFKEE